MDISPVLALLKATAIAFVVATIVGVVVGYGVGGKDRRKRRALFTLASGAVLVLYVVLVLPRLTGTA